MVFERELIVVREVEYALRANRFAVEFEYQIRLEQIDQIGQREAAWGR